MQSTAFYRHLQDAIASNKQRKKVYARLTNRRSIPVSNRMIMLEQLLLPVAKYFDWRGKEFNKTGIPIIVDDFVSMKNIKDVHESPLYNRSVGAETLKRLKEFISKQKDHLNDLANRYDFRQICEQTEESIDAISAFEVTSGSHFAMLKHVVESIGFASVNALRYEQLCGGATKRLSSQLIKFQARGLRTVVKLDLRAQKLHQQNIGIVVNDVPSIPFSSRWRQIRNQSP